MPRPLARMYHDILGPRLRQRAARRGHEMLMLDPRSAVEHRVAHQRSLDEGGDGCPFCRY